MTETLIKLDSQPLGFRTDGVTVASVGIAKERWINVRGSIAGQIQVGFWSGLRGHFQYDAVGQWG